MKTAPAIAHQRFHQGRAFGLVGIRARKQVVVGEGAGVLEQLELTNLWSKA